MKGARYKTVKAALAAIEQAKSLPDLAEIFRWLPTHNKVRVAYRSKRDRLRNP